MTTLPLSFFIFGPERSGTTLLAFLLSGQPGVFALNDSFVFDRYVEWALLRYPRRLDSPLARSARLAFVLGRQLRPELLHNRTWRGRYHALRMNFVSRLGPDYTMSPEQVTAYYRFLKSRYSVERNDGKVSFLNAYAGGLRKLDTEVTLSELFAATISNISSLFAPGVVGLLGEKTPLHTPYADWILTLFPRAKSIVVVRDPIANVASITRRHGDFNEAMRRYGMYADRVLALSERTDTLIVRHEDVIESTASTVQQIMGFLGAAHEFDIACPVNAYTKSTYTGTEVDSERPQAASRVLSANQAHLVSSAFGDIRDRFYN